MINTNKDQYSLNLIPVFGDLGTIILGFFILIVVILLNELKESEKPTEIATNKYFISKFIYELINKTTYKCIYKFVCKIIC